MTRCFMLRVSAHICMLAIALASAGAASAQAVRVVIEDDVAPATALQCAALRMAEAERASRSGATPEALTLARIEAWLAAGVNPGRAVDAWGPYLSAAPASLLALSDTCATFEIRQVRPAGG